MKGWVDVKSVEELQRLTGCRVKNANGDRVLERTGRQKYGAVRSSSGLLPGMSFPSRLEKNVAVLLRAREIAGEISDLRFQQSVDLGAGIRWKIDFCYVEDGRVIYHEAKGVETADYRLKKKLFMANRKEELRISKSAGRNKTRVTEFINEGGR